uniref:Uncharacterized protein n=1 Tax=Rhizophora mucronata TaxID=61149 RepID=A0A2P2P9R7_RHIMU
MLVRMFCKAIVTCFSSEPAMSFVNCETILIFIPAILFFF